MPIDFPESPGLTPTYQYTYNGITQNWYWGFSGGSGVSAWLASGFSITSAGDVIGSIYDLDNVTGQNYNFGIPTNYVVFKYDHSNSSWTPDLINIEDLDGVNISSPTQNQVLTYQSGQWGAAEIPSVIFGEVTGGGAGMTKAPKLAIVAGDGSVTVTGITSDAGITISITAGGGGGGGANPEGPDGSIQFADGSSLSGLAEASVVTDSSVNNSKGYSGNFVFYTESTNHPSGLITNGSETVPFGTKNIHILDNIALADGVTLDIVGFTGAYTGASMTLILGYTGANNSRIRFPANQGIHWGGGPFGVTQGSDAYIYTRTTPKKYDILYFFADGTRIYGNIQTNYSTSR